MRSWLAVCLPLLLCACDPAWGITRSLHINTMPDATCAESAILSLPRITVIEPDGHAETFDFAQQKNVLDRIYQDGNAIIWDSSVIGAGFTPEHTELLMRAAVAQEQAVAKQCHVTYSNIYYKCLYQLFTPSGRAAHEDCRRAYPGLVYLESLDPAIAGTPVNDWSGE